MNRRNFLFTILGVGAIAKAFKPTKQFKTAHMRFYENVLSAEQMNKQYNGGYYVPWEMQKDILRLHAEHLRRERLWDYNAPVKRKAKDLMKNGMRYL